MTPFIEHPECEDARHWIAQRKSLWETLVFDLANQNSGSDNLIGNQKMGDKIAANLHPISDSIHYTNTVPIVQLDRYGKTTTLESAPALLAARSGKTSVKVLLNGHMDTVYSVDHPFQSCRRINRDTLNGPGVTDMKGGLVILIAALEAFEKSSVRSQLSWEVLITADEEVGSHCSRSILEAAAKRNSIGLTFESSPSEGLFVRNRMGTGTMTAIVHGKSAHSGRDFEHGRNAILGLCNFLSEVDALNRSSDKVICNIGRIYGGGPVNVVPDYAVAQLNLRAADKASERKLMQGINAIARRINDSTDYRIELSGQITRPPKIVDARTEELFGRLRRTANAMGLTIDWFDTGGASDGNIFLAAGLPNIDSLGAVGGEIHSSAEYLHIPSLVTRAQLVASFLINLATQRFESPHTQSA